MRARLQELLEIARPAPRPRRMLYQAAFGPGLAGGDPSESCCLSVDLEQTEERGRVQLVTFASLDEAAPARMAAAEGALSEAVVVRLREEMIAVHAAGLRDVAAEEGAPALLGEVALGPGAPRRFLVRSPRAQRALRHYRYFLALVDSARAALSEPESQAALERLRASLVEGEPASG